MKTYNIAIVGATSTIGAEITTILEQRDFPMKTLSLLAEEQASGTKLTYHGKNIAVQALREDSFQGIDLAFFASGVATSQKFAPHAVKAGAVVIDLTNAFRMAADVPLIIPEVNAHAIDQHHGILANPTSATIQLLVALKPIHDAVRIARIVVSTYQSVSDTGKGGVEELDRQIRNIFNYQDIVCEAYPHQIAFNCLPHTDTFQENGYTQEELLLAHETRKILEDDSIGVTATNVRVPVFYGHSEAVNIETEEKITVQAVRELLAKSPGVHVIDDPQKNLYPIAIETVGEDGVFVGRIREDHSIRNGMNLWIVADNLRKGSALNAIQIAELLIQHEDI